MPAPHRASIALSILALLSGANGAPLAQIRLAKTLPRGGRVYRLYLSGKPTKLTVEASNNGPEAPTVDVYRTPKGTVFGTVWHVEDGAYLVGVAITFVQDRSFRVFDGMYVGGHRGERILLLPNQSGPWEVSSDATLIENGKTRNIGMTTKAALEKAGTVRGYYLCTGDRKPFESLISETTEPVYRQYFVWKAGRRTLLGRAKASRGPL